MLRRIKIDNFMKIEKTTQHFLKKRWVGDWWKPLNLPSSPFQVEKWKKKLIGD
jgi:hypothetical protein